MQYDFSMQAQMLSLALEILDEKGLKQDAALGGGTALAGYYWGHRYSTDIDMFIYAKDLKLNILRPAAWSEGLSKKMAAIGFQSANVKSPGSYLELPIDEECKIQFFGINKRTASPYAPATLWGRELLIESVEEIIAKKIDYRGAKQISRDLFDIAIAIHKDPEILNKIDIPFRKIEELADGVSDIAGDPEKRDNYLRQINEMKPNEMYRDVADNAISYLDQYLNDYCYLHNIKRHEEPGMCEDIEKAARGCFK